MIVVTILDGIHCGGATVAGFQAMTVGIRLLTDLGPFRGILRSDPCTGNAIVVIVAELVLVIVLASIGALAARLGAHVPSL